jgi:hypothetical protein
LARESSRQQQVSQVRAIVERLCNVVDANVVDVSQLPHCRKHLLANMHSPRVDLAAQEADWPHPYNLQSPPDAADASEAVEQSEAVTYTSADGCFSLSQALYDEGDTTAALPHLECCADSRDDWMLPRILLGKALLRGKQDAPAKPILEAALQLAVDQHHIEPAAELRSLLADL